MKCNTSYTVLNIRDYIQSEKYKYCKHTSRRTVQILMTKDEKYFTDFKKSPGLTGNLKIL